MSRLKLYILVLAMTFLTLIGFIFQKLLAPSTNLVKENRVYKGKKSMKDILLAYPGREGCRRSPASLELNDSDTVINTGLALRESNDFIDEPDYSWKLRRRKHYIQRCKQRSALGSCPDGSVMHPCRPSCNIDFEKCTDAEFWQDHYEPSFACEFEERIGPVGDGGKWVCNPRHLLSRGSDCIVYSIGSNGDYGFEEFVHEEISPDCKIFTVDQNDWNHYTSHPPPPYVTYVTHRIGPLPDTPVHQIVEKLGHTNKTIDLFKIDCEGCEWETFEHWFERGVNIRQVLVELHNTGDGRAHDFFDFLSRLGYVIFHKEANILAGGSCIEFGLIKLDPEFALLKQV